MCTPVDQWPLNKSSRPYKPVHCHRSVASKQIVAPLQNCAAVTDQWPLNKLLRPYKPVHCNRSVAS